MMKVFDTMMQTGIDLTFVKQLEETRKLVFTVQSKKIIIADHKDTFESEILSR